MVDAIFHGRGLPKAVEDCYLDINMVLGVTNVASRITQIKVKGVAQFARRHSYSLRNSTHVDV